MAALSAPAQANPSEQESVHSPAHRSEQMSARASAPASEDRSGTATVRMSASLKVRKPVSLSVRPLSARPSDHQGTPSAEAAAEPTAVSSEPGQAAQTETVPVAPKALAQAKRSAPGSAHSSA